MSQQAGRGRKSRIVIDVEQARAAAHVAGRGRRRRRPLSIAALVVAGLLVVALVGAYAWWQGYKKGPSYSLALLVDAARHDDVQAVETLIDADRVAQGFVPQVIEKLTGAGTALPPEARARVAAALPQLLPRVRETVREEIARGMKAATEGVGDTSFVVLALGIPRAAEIKEDGDAATATFAREGKQTELAMQRSGDRWKVVTVKDDDLANDIAGRLAASIPQGPPPPTNQPRRRQGR
jgi:uncharacterized membrane protein